MVSGRQISKKVDFLMIFGTFFFDNFVRPSGPPGMLGTGPEEPDRQTCRTGPEEPDWQGNRTGGTGPGETNRTGRTGLLSHATEPNRTEPWPS